MLWTISTRIDSKKYNPTSNETRITMSYRMLCCNKELINVKNKINEKDNLPVLKISSVAIDKRYRTNQR